MGDALKEKNHHKKDYGQYIKQGKDDYVEQYSTQVLSNLNKKSKFEQMKFIKVKRSKNMDIKSKMLKEYSDPVKGSNYRNIDLERIEKEQ